MIPKCLFRTGALAMLVALVPAFPAHAATTTVDTSVCNTNPVFSQPFQPFGDSNMYTLAPGQSPDNFTGSGWTLSGGATLTSASLADGASGKTLQMTYGSEAVSPILCVQSNYPTARMEVRDLV